MDQPPAVAFTAFADVWPRATRSGDRRRPMRHWRGRNFNLDLTGQGRVAFPYVYACKAVLHWNSAFQLGFSGSLGIRQHSPGAPL